ncbi:MAG: hypothetical protein MHPSP_004342, partial [Paramarteilia canceri]
RESDKTGENREGLVKVQKTDGLSLFDGASNMKCLDTISSFEQHQCYLDSINLFVVDIIYKRTFLLEPEIDPEEDDETSYKEQIHEIFCSEELDDIINLVQKMMAQLTRSKKLRYKLRRYTNLGPVNNV